MPAISASVRRVAAVVVLALLAPLVASAPSSAETAGYDFSVLGRCVSSISFAVSQTDTGYVVEARKYGYRFDETTMTEGSWTSITSTDAVERLLEYGLMWVPSLLRYARDTGDTRQIEPLVASIASSLGWRPDTGSPSDPVWNEGVNLRREQSLNCLYRVTHDDRLVPLLTAVVGANLDPLRYYGPPRRLPHNHGLMANVALLDTAAQLDRPDWRDAAIDRLRTAIDLSFTRAGLTVEQSMAYGAANIVSWTDAAAQVRALGAGEIADRIGLVLRKARRALEYTRTPTGAPVNFGDQAAPVAPFAAQQRLTLVDPDAGVLAGRWSWTAPDDFYAVRFGGPMQMHGHEDRLSLVWWATGRPVLVDPGTADYTVGTLSAWTRSHVAHSVPTVAGRSFAPKAVISRVENGQVGAVATATLTGAPYGVTQTRAITVNSATDTLSLVDHAARGTVNQVLQLAPRWVVRSTTRTTAVLVDATGARLTLTTTGTIAGIRRGASGLAGGWLFTYPPSTRVAAARIVITGATSRVATTLRVVGSPERPWLR